MLMKSTDFTSKVISSANLCFSVFEYLSSSAHSQIVSIYILDQNSMQKTESLYSEMNCNYGEIHNQKSISKCFFRNQSQDDVEVSLDCWRF